MRPTLARDQALNAKERANARVLEPTLEDENQDPNYRHVGSDGMGELGKRCLNYNLELFDIDHDVCYSCFDSKFFFSHAARASNVSKTCLGHATNEPISVHLFKSSRP